ncbi:MAG: efflux RND transporter periplasmic adaptor subunit [Variibacter sp.]
MRKRAWVITGLAVLAIAVVGIATRSYWTPYGANAQAPAGKAAPQRAVPVDIATAVKKPTPVRIDALGTVTPIASVAIKARLETTIEGVHFNDGAAVKAGDLLFTLDGRVLDAQVAQAEGVLARDRAQLEGAERDVRRYTELVAKNATPTVNLDNAKTQADTFRASIKADEAALANLKVQQTYTKIYAPISGRISAANVKVGNFVRPADTAPLATINQMKPVYVVFSIPQNSLPGLRDAMQAGSTHVDAIIPGSAATASGAVSMIDNSVDVSSGMVPVRASMANDDEALWPGTLVNAQLTLRVEEAVVVPSVAVQVGQKGTYVFVVKDEVATVRPVKVDRTVDAESVIAEGLSGGEVVVTDGQLLLAEGTKVSVRQAKAGS